MLNDMQKNGAIRWSLSQTPVNRYEQLVTRWSFVHVTHLNHVKFPKPKEDVWRKLLFREK